MSKKLRNSRRNISRGHSHISIRRRIRYYYVRFMQVSIVLLVLGAVLILKAPYFTSTRQDFAIQLQEMRDTMIPWSIEHIEIIGNRHLSKEQIVQILDIDIGTPIFHVDIEKSLQALSDNGWVQAAIIKRILPNTLLIELVEKTPAAIWQYNKNLNLIDISGNIITDQDLDQFADLVHVIGEDAGIHIGSLLTYLNQSSSIRAELLSATRYGSRRWNLVFQEGFVVKMPEDAAFADAWNYLLKLHTQNKLFNEFYYSIDLRNGNKYFIEYKE